MLLPITPGSVTGPLVSDLEERFVLAGINLTSQCRPGHDHDGARCGLDITAHEPDDPTMRVELIAADGVDSVSAAPSLWVQAEDPDLMARAASAYFAALKDPRLPDALDATSASTLCEDCETTCTPQRGRHSVERAVMVFPCGTDERRLAGSLMSRWAGTGQELLDVVVVTFG